MGGQEKHQFDQPSPQVAEQAAQARRQMAALLKQDKETHLFFKDGETEVPLPISVLPMLTYILEQLALGRGVAIIPNQEELTTQEAADFLNVSRPYLVKLLDEGKIPHHMVGVRRRVLFKDVQEYKEKRRARSRQALDELTQEAQALDMGY